MALSARAQITGIGAALAIGVLGGSGVAYATGAGAGDAGVTYMTVDDADTASSTPDSSRPREGCPGDPGTHVSGR